jgi:HSP20 family protein
MRFDLILETKKMSTMILTRNYPARNLNNVFDELFNALPATAANDAKSNSAAPVNISEGENGYQLEFSVPGRNKEDFKISLENGLLTVSYEKKDHSHPKETKVIRSEFSYPSFKRAFNLDQKINAEGIEAKYDNGILKVFLPKKEEVKNTPKQISIQ